MGWTILYIAFGIVALWLLGEVLLQYKARLRWRLLAFVGFLGVVIGVLMPSVLVIAVGAIAFAIGQTYVTLSFRSGFSRGWALKGLGRFGRTKDDAPSAEPTLEVSDLQAVDGPEDQGAPEVHQPQPIPEETGQYGVYGSEANPYGRESYGREPYAGETGYDDSVFTAGAPGYGATAYQEPGYGAEPQSPFATYGDYGQNPQPDQSAYAAQYDYGNGQYAAYSDPYNAAGAPQGYDPYGGYGGQQQYDYGTGQYADPYAAAGQQPHPETPPGGVWVPQQREDGQATPEQDEQAYYQQGYQPGYGEYRY
ncbi:hypothetical protein ACFYYR_22415 [Streptomyces sp. NPDC001922]|uniref:hypothetical protein n=1 Tax=Streptomyces sp. NPDC001922 TaxID=3364624 RepID=UPI0036A18CE9